MAHSEKAWSMEQGEVISNFGYEILDCRFEDGEFELRIKERLRVQGARRRESR